MHHSNRQYFRLPDKEWLAGLHFLQINARYSRILLIHKAIRHPYPQMSSSISIRIDRYLRKTAKRTQIIQPARMVIMFVSDQHTIYLFINRRTQYLCSEIGAAIYQYRRIIRMQQRRCPQAVVPRIGRRANRARTTNLRYPGRCSTS